MRNKEEDLEYLGTVKAIDDEMVLTDHTFDPISKYSMPLFSTLFINLMLVSDTMLLHIPSKICARNEFYHIETAGGRSDGTESFYRKKDPIRLRTELNRRYDSECPLMIHVRNDRSVICGADVPDQECFIFAEAKKSHPGYCRLLHQFNKRRIYLQGWNVMPQLDPSDAVAKRSVPGYPCYTWPHSAEEWLTRTTSSSWPGSALKSVIRDAGCLVVQIAHPASSTPEIEWRFLFNNAEKKLMEAIPSHRYPYYIFKIAVDFFTKDLKVRLHTVHLKSIFFFTCEKLHKTEFQEFPGYCFLFMIHDLLNHLMNGYLPNYFIKENNMIDHYADEDICQIKEMVELIRVFPFPCLLFLLKEHGYQRSWIMETLHNGANKGLNTNDIIVPLMVRLAQHLARDENVRSSYRIIEEVYALLTLVPFTKNGKILPTPSKIFLVRESMKNFDEYTKCKLTQMLRCKTRIGMSALGIPIKKVKDLMGGENVAGLGEETIPADISGDAYDEASYLNSLGVDLHNNQRRYEEASKFYFSAVEHLEKASEKLTNDINKGAHDTEQAEIYQNMLDNDSLSFLCFQNLSKCYFDVEFKERLKDRMPFLETICKRSFGQEGVSFVKKLWERLGFQGRGKCFQNEASFE